MNIRQILVLTAIPVWFGTFGLMSLHQANAANKFQQIAQATDTPKQPPSDRQRPPRPDLKAAAAKLGVTEAQLKAALGVPANPPTPGDRNQRPPRPDLKAAAAKLGVTEQQLIDALGIPPRPQGDRQAPPPADR